MVSRMHPIHNHPLTLVENTTELYPEYNGQWQCNICAKIYDNNHQSNHCPSCKFDICLPCFQPKKHPLHHPSHDLYYTDMMTVYPQYQGKWKCDGCHKLMTPPTEKCSYHCFRDQFDLCSRCFDGQKYPVHRHPLKPVKSTFVYGESPGLWVCDVCNRTGANMLIEDSWHCGRCEFDVCKECRDFEVIIPQHNHSLRIVDPLEVYERYAGSWKCDICETDFRPNRSSGNDIKRPYHCSQCEYDICNTCLSRIRGNRFEQDLDVTGPPAVAHIGDGTGIQHSAFSQFHLNGSANPYMPPQELMEKDEETYEDLNESERCVVCTVRPKNATIVHGHTGHICCCLSCAYTLDRRGDPCPICRAPIDRVIRQFTS